MAYLSASSPQTDAVATTWPTSWTAAPAQAPNSRVSKFKACPINGSTKIERVPHNEIKPIAYDVSSSVARVCGLIAATAVAPHTPKPTPIRSPSSPDILNSFDNPRIPKIVKVTTITTVITPLRPISFSDTTLTWAPKSATPIRIIVLLETLVAGAANAGHCAKFATKNPKATHNASGLIADCI